MIVQLCVSFRLQSAPVGAVHFEVHGRMGWPARHWIGRLGLANPLCQLIGATDNEIDLVNGVITQPGEGLSVAVARCVVG
jgi:hypothetical protein